ncbi:ATP-binding cassette domain-containing protein [Granulicatella adiacens ATCC 49175]|jgi:ABC superfamily ATP binding cassette transporter, ABC protein|uniref:ABC transporter, ATP-binding protein n=1 Tax=Granulicatella adiacens ATCC 49175 TaxID=638301 RepID=C8NH44_9LACT|nr:ATP-binding cassette domain-containing protein [Granulicatella adiacens]EEW37021.1 ABC transporter, ATP-binding protein [Granulicatella adiacens ATCC 49175]UAK94313.1 ATP-binding cassette domain-containing protein [Granulicatella adiacens]UWP38446.1 ATP-binding cassette domain-containing protein [Granulicatella adiacens ATCC 49175]UXY41725.1 ATP-binding cassette domain-containing protein [Granulicatella adiacens]
MIKLENIDVTFKQGVKVVNAVKNVSLHVEPGDIYGIIGYSGAGKSTLVRTINLLQRPTKGNVVVNGVDLLKLKPKGLRAARKKIGMIFQHFNLMNTLSVFDNVAFPLKKSGKTKSEIEQKVLSLLELVGLEDKVNSYPRQLSGGQKQRVAIARALANDPDVLLCDEATSALDPKTTYSILELLQKVNVQLGITIVIITHEMQVVKEICNKVAVMEEGEVIEQGSVLEIFTNPERDLTKDFIDTATHINQGIETVLSHEQLLNLQEGDYLVKISFVGASTGEPLITKLSTQFQVAANILFANVEIIQDTPVGTLLVGLSGEKSGIENALSYIKEQGVSVDVLEESKGGA